MKDFFFLEDTLAHVLELEKEKLDLEEEIKSSKSQISKERSNGKHLSNELVVLKEKYTESTMTQKISTLGDEIVELKKGKSQTKNKRVTHDDNEKKFIISIGVLFAVLVLLGGMDLHHDLQDMPFVCNNDEIILASEVNNEVDDCTDGSDEGDTWLGSTRAEEYEMEVSDGAFFTVIFGALVFVPASGYALVASRGNKTLLTLMIILVSSSSVGLYSTIDLNQTWECDDGEQIHWSWVLDGKQSCADGSDERKSGWSGDMTRAEDSSMDMWLAYHAYSFWALGVFILLIWWFLESYVFSHTNIIDDLEKEEKKINRYLSSKENEYNQLKRDLKRMKKLPHLIKLSDESVIDVEMKNANANARVLTLKHSISNEMDKVSHLIPYSNS